MRLIVPFPPGGPADVIARFVGQKLSEDWGQTVVVENRPGGNTAIAAQQVARSAPDGYTLLIPMDTTMVLNPLTLTNLPYEPLKDFIPITMLTKNMSLVVTRMAGPKSIKELIEQAKAQARQDEHGRRHDHLAARRGAVRQDRRHRRAAHSVQGQRRDRPGGARRHRRFRARLDRHRASFGPRGPIPRAGEIYQPAAAACFPACRA